MSNILLWYATRGAGVTVLVLLTLSLILGILSISRAPTLGWPRFMTTALHRYLALLSLVFLAVHIITSVVDPYTHLGSLVAFLPFNSSYRTFWLGLGTLAFDLLLAVFLTSILRLHLPYRLWRAVHFLTYLAWPVGMLHGLGTGTDISSPWFLAVNLACLLTLAFAVFYRLDRGPALGPSLLPAR